MLTVVVEDNRTLRVLQLLLDPHTPQERFVAYADYMRHDCPDFGAWCESVRAKVSGLYPSRVVLIDTQQQLCDTLTQADIVVVESLALDTAELDRALNLKVIQEFGLHHGNVDIAQCERRGISVLTLRRRTNIAVAEHTMALILALSKRLPRFTGTVTAARLAAAGYPFQPYDKRHTPGANFGRIPQVRALHSATLGVLGMGETGAEVTAQARAFGMHVLYHKRQRLPLYDEQRLQAEYCSFHDLFSRSDFLTIHLPLTAETRGIVNRGALSQMRSDAFLVNTSRAEIIDRAALLEFVANKTSGGVALDVLYEEPAEEHDALLQNERVLLTPHLAGGSRYNGLVDMEQMLVDLRNVLRDAFSNKK